MMDKKVSGSFTVEAVLIMPMILMVIFMSICFSLWLRDRTTVTAVLLESVQLTRTVTAEDASEWLKEELDALYFTRGEMRDVWEEGGMSKVSYRGEPSTLWQGIQVSFEEQEEREHYDPVLFLRLCNLALK